ncbi:MAG: formylglycine-generating enzyme family protein, partial [SAR116 cluster bacterium]|nr:formylglycine-generating enzyme family protein [SAR116 cluster bacterium]
MTDKNDRDVDGCCTGPNAEKGFGGVESVTMPPPVPGPRQVADHAVQGPGGRAYVGTSRSEIADDGEGPVRRVGVKPFLIGATSVTNAEFAAFVEETGHVSEAA